MLNSRLFEPGRLGTLTLPNRIIYSPMSLRSTDGHGHYTEAAIASMELRAEGGCGLVIAPGAMAWASSTGYGLSVSIAEDDAIPHMREVARRIRRHGACAALQIGARGTRTEGGAESIAPSAMRFGYEARIPRALSVEEIEGFVRDFGQAARRAREAGFDAVLLHACTGKLLSMFMSPYSNRRTDCYGGTTENRMRFVLDALAAMKRDAGSDFPVMARMSVDERLGERGVQAEEGVRMAAMLDAAGADGIQVMSGTQERIWNTSCGYFYPDAYAGDLNRPVRNAVNCAVIAAGKLGNPDVAEVVLERGDADFISLGRPLLVDPFWPKKVREGHSGEIRRCTGCLNCFTFASRQDIEPRGVSCTVNPGVLREPEFDALSPALRRKRILVAGGGLAGMEAAAVLAARGHDVELHEAAEELGGQWVIASHAPYRKEYRHLVPWLERRMRMSGVRVFLNSSVDADRLLRIAPEYVVLAIGAKPRELPFPASRPEAAGPEVVQGCDVIMDRARAGQRVVVVGGRYVGMEAALKLAEAGRHVSIIDAGEIARDTNPRLNGVYRDRLVELGVYMYPNTPLLGFTGNGVDAAHIGSLLHLPCDTVVLAIGTVSVQAPELEAAAARCGAGCRRIGDCRKVGDALYALREGAELGRRI